MKKSVDFYEIYDYYYIPFWQTLWFKVVIGFSVCALIGLLIFLWLKRTPKKLSSWEWALQEIAKLSATQRRNKEDYKRFYYALTDIIKSYLHKRYSWNTRDKTDPELIEYLKQQQFDPSLIALLQKMSDEALWIKFANVEALKSQAEEDLQVITTLIERTKTTMQK